MNRVQIKETAKNLLKKNHWLCVGVGLIVSLLGYINVDFTGNGDAYSEIFSNLGLSDILNGNLNKIIEEAENFSTNTNPLTELMLLTVSIIITAVLTVFVGNQILVGARRFFLKYRKNHPVEVGELFKSYTDKTFLNVAKVTFIKDLSVFLWSLLCIVPGIIKAYEYAAVEYILAVNPTMEYTRALDLSKKVMNGHKMELFELQFSFLGWHILSLFTCGLLNILYIQPYLLIAEAEFFSYVREIAIFNGIISYNDIPDYEQFNSQPFAYQNSPPAGNYYYNQPTNPMYTTSQPTTYTTPIQPAQYTTPVQPPQNISPAQPVATPSYNPVATQVTAPAQEQLTQKSAEAEPITEEPSGEKNTEIE